MTRSHADQHDLDKLSGWYRDLSAGPSGRFPVYALFLVTPEASYAHDIFREFRSSFKARNAGFEHVMIFGQHGVSSTVEGFLSRLEFARDRLPLLVLFRGPSAGEVYPQGLPPDSPDSNEAWRAALSEVERAADEGWSDLNPASLSRAAPTPLRDGSMRDLAGLVLGRVSDDP